MGLPLDLRFDAMPETARQRVGDAAGQAHFRRAFEGGLAALPPLTCDHTLLAAATLEHLPEGAIDEIVEKVHLADLVVALSLLSVLVGGFFTRFRLRFAGRPAQAGS